MDVSKIFSFVTDPFLRFIRRNSRLVYWLPRDIEQELGALESADERHAIRAAVHYAMLRKFRFWALFVTGMLGIAIVAPWAMITTRSILPFSHLIGGPVVMGGIIGGILGGGLGFGVVLVYANMLRRGVRERLIARNIIVCLKCGYNLTGATASRCPECGEISPHLQNLPSDHVGGGSTGNAAGGPLGTSRNSSR